MSVRLRRLQAEYDRISQLFADHDRIRIIETFGNPPDRYVIEYRLTGLVEEQGEIRERLRHRAQIVLGRNYPNELPRCSMLTPVFHPNIDHLRICTEDIGSAGKTIDQVITFIGEMIAYQTYNVKSPLNGDAARWTIEHLNRLPLEKVDLTPKATLGPPIRIPGRIESPAVSPVPAAPQTTTAPPGEEAPAVAATVETWLISLRCGNCGQTAEEASLSRCVNSHLVCENCALACQICANSVCVLCDIRTCANCAGVVCQRCQVKCGAAGHLVCSDCSLACAACTKTICVLCELRNCAACQGVVCSNCLVLCPGCQQPYCRGHAHLCKVCNKARVWTYT